MSRKTPLPPPEATLGPPPTLPDNTPDTPATQPGVTREPPRKPPRVATGTSGSPWWFDPEDTPDDWASKSLPDAIVHGLEDEEVLREFAESQHELDFRQLFEWANRCVQYLKDRVDDLAERRLNLHKQRDETPTVLKDPTGAKDLTLWAVAKLSMLSSAMVGAMLAGLGYSYTLARNAGIAEQPADAAMLAVCLLGVAGFLHVINHCLPKQVLRDAFLGAQAIVGIIAAVLFWLLLADGAAGAVEAGDFYATVPVAAEPDTPSALSGIAFCVLEACATSVFLELVLRSLNNLNPKTIQNPVLVEINSQLDALTADESALAIDLARAEAICKSEDAHRHACVELLVANWRAKRQVRAYKLNETV